MTGIPYFLPENNAKLNLRDVQRALIVYDDNEFYLGDNCIILHRLGLCGKFFAKNAQLDINFLNNTYFERYADLCKNNPAFANVSGKKLDNINCNDYDLLLFIAPDEQPYATWLHQKYAAGEKPSFAAFSFSKAVFGLRENISQPVLPFQHELFNYCARVSNQPYELYVSAQEKEWGNQWLENYGIDKTYDVFIVADYTSKRFKLLRSDVYHKVLMYLLSKENSMILIFDETDMGKEQFYREWLKEKYMHRFIFVNGLSIRDALCITSSEYVKMVFGPCTGILHCASGIYNRFLKDGLDVSRVPVMITYTGPWDAHYWWKNSPLVDCLLLRNINGQKKMSLLTELSDEEKSEWEDRLQCSEYTAEMITGFIDSRLSATRIAPPSYATA